MSNEQQLNSLSRFRKQSGRLVLEEHSHCEIPAGCGGVVLRWRNPLAALPVSIHFYSAAPATCWFDGVEVQIGRMDLVIGRHVLALAVEQVDLSAGLILFVINHDPKDYQRGKTAQTITRRLKVLSAADGSWKFSLAPPPAEWMSLSFDDRDWPALTRTSMPMLNRSDAGYYASRRCSELGAVCLGLPPGKHSNRGRVWIRKVFEVPPA
jgi:hypothetical protein